MVKILNYKNENHNIYLNLYKLKYMVNLITYLFKYNHTNCSSFKKKKIFRIVETTRQWTTYIIAL